MGLGLQVLLRAYQTGVLWVYRLGMGSYRAVEIAHRHDVAFLAMSPRVSWLYPASSRGNQKHLGLAASEKPGRKCLS